MKRMKKKITALLTTVLLCTALASNVFAQEFSADGTGSCLVTASVASTWTVKVPVSLGLAYDGSSNMHKGTYTVGAKGNIATNKYVEIVPDSSVTLTGSGTGTNVTATSTQADTKWARSSSAGYLEIGTTSFADTTGLLTCNLSSSPADSYSGTMTFTFELKDK